MIEAVLVVLTKAHPGREEDLDDWYTNIHVRDALRFRGSIAAQRFSRSARQPMELPETFDWQRLALYDDSVLEDYHYYPLAFRDNDPASPHRGGVVLEQMNAAPGREQEYREWYADSYLPQAAKRPGVQSAGFAMFRTFGQMIPTTPSHNYVGIYKVNDANAWQAWQDAPLLTDAPDVDEVSVRVTHWEHLTDKLTKDAVQNPTSEGLAAEEQARRRMGDKVLTGGADKLGAA